MSFRMRMDGWTNGDLGLASSRRHPREHTCGRARHQQLIAIAPTQLNCRINYSYLRSRWLGTIVFWFIQLVSHWGWLLHRQSVIDFYPEEEHHPAAGTRTRLLLYVLFTHAGWVDALHCTRDFRGFWCYDNVILREAVIRIRSSWTRVTRVVCIHTPAVVVQSTVERKVVIVVIMLRERRETTSDI